MKYYKNLLEVRKAHEKIMTDYKTDLDYDFYNIADNRNTSHLLINRGTGTSLLILYSAKDFPIKKHEIKPYLFGHVDRKYYLKDHFEACIDYYSKSFNKPVLITYHDGKKDIDKQVTIEQAYKIVMDYVKSIRNKWVCEDIAV